MQKPFINVFTTLYAIQQHSWTTLVWIGQSLKRLYEQLSGFVFNMQVSIFNWKPVLPDFTMSVNFVQFIRFVNVFWPLTKCHKESKYHSNKIVLSMRKKVANRFWATGFPTKPFVVHYEKIRIHLRGKTNNCVTLYSSYKKRSFARKSGSITIFLF